MIKDLVLEKSCIEYSQNWLSAAKFAETRRKTALRPSNGSLYHYAGNNPVRYIDPSGESTRNATNKYLLARTEDNITYRFEGKDKSTHYVILKPGDYSPEAFDGVFDGIGNAVKVSGDSQAEENINFTVISAVDNTLNYFFDDGYSMDLNNVNDSGKEIANFLFPEFLSDYDLSGNYENIDVNGNPLHSWWNSGIEAVGTPDKWKEKYNTAEQQAIRDALRVKNEANK